MASNLIAMVFSLLDIFWASERSLFGSGEAQQTCRLRDGSGGIQLAGAPEEGMRQDRGMRLSFFFRCIDRTVVLSAEEYRPEKSRGSRCLAV